MGLFGSPHFPGPEIAHRAHLLDFVLKHEEALSHWLSVVLLSTLDTRVEALTEHLLKDRPGHTEEDARHVIDDLINVPFGKALINSWLAPAASAAPATPAAKTPTREIRLMEQLWIDLANRYHDPQNPEEEQILAFTPC